MPNIKLVSLLRNPIDRAFSHYKMQVLRNAEHRTFDEVVDDLLREEAIEKGRKCRLGNYSSYMEAEKWCYLVWGEYDRIISSYMEHFSKKQIKILYTKNLSKKTSKVLNDFFGFVGVNDNFVPSNIQKKYHTSDDERVRKDGLLSARGEGGVVDKTMRILGKAVPETMKKIAYIVNKSFLKKSDEPSMSKKTRKKLVSFYRPDVLKLEKTLKEKPPWDEFYND